MTQVNVDNFPITSELVSLLSSWTSMEVLQSNLIGLENMQDYLIRLLGEANSNELKQIAVHLEYIVGIKDGFKELLHVLTSTDD